MRCIHWTTKTNPPPLLIWGVRVTGATATLIGSYWLVAWLGGWAAQWSAQGSATGAIVMKTNMALGQLLGGLALLLLAGSSAGLPRRAAGAGLAAVVFLIGVLTFGEHLSGYDLGIDQLLARERPGAVGTISPNRIGPPGSLSLALLGAGLLALAWGRRGVVPWVGLAVCLINLVPAVGFLYGIEDFYSRPHLTIIAWPTVVALLSLGAGLMFAQRETGPLVLLLRDDPGGALLRRLLPMALCVPLMLGFLRVQAERHGWVDMPTGTGYMVLAFVVIFSSLLWRNAGSLSQSAEIQEEARVALKEAQQELELRVQERTAELRRAMEELQRTTQILHAISQHSPDLVYAKDCQGRLVFASESTLRVLGKSAEEVLGKIDTEFHADPCLGEAVMENDRTVRETRRPLVVEEPTRLPDGTVGVFRSTKVPWIAADGTLMGMFGISVDITEIKRAEVALKEANESLERRVEERTATLRESEERFRIAQELSLDAFTLLTAVRDDSGAVVDFRWDYVNPEAGRILRHAPERLVGRCLLDVLPGNKTNSELFDRYVRVVETGMPHEIEVIYESEGIRGWFRNMAVKLGDGIAICFSDITGRKRAEEALRESEQRFRIMGEALPYGVWWCNEHGGVEYASQSFLDLLEMSMEEMREFGWTHRMPPGEVEPMMRKWLHCIQTGEDWDGEHHLLGPDGKYHTVLTRGKPVRDGMGKIIGWVGINLNIDLRKQIEEQLKTQTTELIEADRRKDEFLAMLAHELRNPLAPVRYAIQILRMPEVPEEARQRQQAIIDRQVTHMARLLDDLLDVSRVTRGKVELRRQPLCLADVLVHAADTVRPICETKRQHLHFTPPPADLWVDADIDRLAQVVGNLLVNASKFTGEGGQIWLESAREDPGAREREQALIRVRDTGLGITPEILPRIFDLFVQADDPRHRSQGGLGIGLTLVRRLVEMHGGTVEARSAGECQGSEFLIRLPALPRENLEAPVPQTLVREASANCCRRILVVDDIVDAAASLAELLALWGHDARAVHDGAAAIEMVRSCRPEVVLMDIGMPGMDGYETARLLRAEHGRNELILVALTGFGQEADREAAHEAGFDTHLVKPVAPNALRELLARIL